MVIGAEVVVAPGLFYINCSSGTSEAGEAIADGPNWHLQGCPFGENLADGQSEWLWGQQIHTWMHQASCLYPMFGYGPGDLLPNFLNS